MKNFVQAGSNLTLTAAAVITSGQMVKVGAIVGVAAGSAAIGQDVDLVVTGVFTLPKVAIDDMAVGDLVYWDDTAKLVTKTSAGNTKIGAAVAAAGNPSGSVRVRLNGSF